VVKLPMRRFKDLTDKENQNSRYTCREQNHSRVSVIMQTNVPVFSAILKFQRPNQSRNRSIPTASQALIRTTLSLRSIAFCYSYFHSSITLVTMLQEKTRSHFNTSPCIVTTGSIRFLLVSLAESNYY